jgi:hypothetical protein
MSRSKQYLASLLDQIPLAELPSFESRTTFENLKGRLTAAEDLPGELKTLYKVQNCSELALTLLWITQRVEQDPSMLEPSFEDQTLLLTQLQHALGEVGGATEAVVVPESPAEPPVSLEPTASPAAEEDPFAALRAEAGVDSGTSASAPAEAEQAAEDPFAALYGESGPSATEPSGETAAPTIEPSSHDVGTPSAAVTPVEEAGLGTETVGESAAETPPAVEVPMPSAEGEMSPEERFGKMVERTVEAIQSGSEEREAIVQEMIALCQAVAADENQSDDYKMFASAFSEFLTYITENQFLDDIRVMNLISNITDPVLEWVRAGEGNRAGLMEPAYDVLRDFKSLFE